MPMPNPVLKDDDLVIVTVEGVDCPISGAFLKDLLAVWCCSESDDAEEFEKELEHISEAFTIGLP